MPKKKSDEVSRRYKTIAEKMIGISNEYDSITKGEMSFPFYDGDFDLSLFKESRTLIKEVAEFYSVEETTAVLLSLLPVKQRKLVYVDDLFEKLKLPYLCYSILENHFNELNDRCFIFLLQMKKYVDKEAIVMTDAFLDSLKHNAHFNPVPKVCADEEEFMQTFHKYILSDFYLSYQSANKLQELMFANRHLPSADKAAAILEKHDDMKTLEEVLFFFTEAESEFGNGKGSSMNYLAQWDAAQSCFTCRSSFERHCGKIKDGQGILFEEGLIEFQSENGLLPDDDMEKK